MANRVEHIKEKALADVVMNDDTIKEHRGVATGAIERALENADAEFKQVKLKDSSVD